MSMQRDAQHLKSRRSELETMLDLYEARRSFSFDDIDDGVKAELKARISEVSRELSELQDKGPL